MHHLYLVYHLHPVYYLHPVYHLYLVYHLYPVYHLDSLRCPCILRLLSPVNSWVSLYRIHFSLPGW